MRLKALEEVALPQLQYVQVYDCLPVCFLTPSLAHSRSQIEALEDVERAFVHVDYRARDTPEHKVERGLLRAASSPPLL